MACTPNALPPSGAVEREQAAEPRPPLPLLLVYVDSVFIECLQGFLTSSEQALHFIQGMLKEVKLMRGREEKKFIAKAMRRQDTHACTH